MSYVKGHSFGIHKVIIYRVNVRKSRRHVMTDGLSVLDVESLLRLMARILCTSSIPVSYCLEAPSLTRLQAYVLFEVINMIGNTHLSALKIIYGTQYTVCRAFISPGFVQQIMP
jgi:hypothetical protein